MFPSTPSVDTWRVLVYLNSHERIQLKGVGLFVGLFVDAGGSTSQHSLADLHTIALQVKAAQNRYGMCANAALV
jgi:hypothetical protein